MECDVIIYDIIHDPEQVDEACWAISTLHSEIDKIDKPKVFILLSTVMTWAKTKPVDAVSGVKHQCVGRNGQLVKRTILVNFKIIKKKKLNICIKNKFVEK